MEAGPLLNFETNRRGALAAMAGAALLAGADKPAPKLTSAPPKASDTVGDWAMVIAQRTQSVEGVGLVVGLNGTGSDPETGVYREELLDQMRKAGVDGAATILASPNTSLVIVRATIPPGVSPVDPLDVTIELTPNSSTTSLEGGYLMRTTLREVLMTERDIKEGSPLGSAYGPIMIGDAKDAKNPKAGRVLGGARVKKEVPFRLALKEKHQSIRSSAMVQDVINRRFAVKIGPESRGVATAKTDQHLELKIPQVYHQNQARFFQVIKLLPIVDREELRSARLAQWREELKSPKTAGVAALRLEGVGAPGVEALEDGLKSKDLESRFFAAEALAYLQKESGVAVLKEVAKSSEEFRAFALAALAAADQPAAMMALRALMSDSNPVIRYGAFAALRTADPENSYLGRISVIKDRSDQAVDNMAAAIVDMQSRRRRGAALDDPFELYVVDSEGPPMVHYTRTNRAEIVLFGANQKLETPIVLGSGGSIILNASESDDKVEISRITRNSLDHDQKVISTLEMRDVIREVANLGATYPEIVELLNAASKQHNLQGSLLADAKPVTSAVYQQAQLVGKRLDEMPKKDDAVAKATAVDVEEEPRGGPLRIFRLPRFRGIGGREDKPAPEPARPSDSVPKKPPYKSLRPYVPFLNSKPSPPRLPEN
jgi:flagellar basal body P-ring protein FlgI